MSVLIYFKDNYLTYSIYFLKTYFIKKPFCKTFPNFYDRFLTVLRYYFMIIWLDHCQAAQVLSIFPDLMIFFSFQFTKINSPP